MKRISLLLTDRDLENLRSLSGSWRVDPVVAVQKALILYRFLLQEVLSGSQVLLYRKDGSMDEVLLCLWTDGLGPTGSGTK